jgi:arabinogalactan endo-1,4-beta-galactosidase
MAHEQRYAQRVFKFLQGFGRRGLGHREIGGGAYPWTTSDGDSEPDPMTNVGTSPYPQTPAGQAQFLGAVTDIVKAIPDAHGKGVFWWEPEWIPTPNVGWKVGASDQWDNNTLFDFHGNALSSLDAFRLR